MNEIFSLTCEDASHLGGPMGTEYTTHMFTKIFSTVDKAQRYAETYQKSSLKWRWTRQRSGDITCDFGAYIWRISPVKIEE